MNSATDSVLELPSPRVVLFCRPPCPGADGGEGRDCDSQEHVLRSWLEWNIGQIGDVCVIKAGYDTKSHEAARATLMDLLKAGGCIYLLVTSLDRLGRGLEVFDILELANKAKARVVAVDEGINTMETDWRLLAMFTAMKQGFSCEAE